MPWTVTIRSINRTPLGNLAKVRQQIEASLPTIKFYRTPSGAEKIEIARRSGVEYPGVLRQLLEKSPATLQADFESDGVFLRLYGFENEPIEYVRAEIRGNGNPMPALAALCLPNEWVPIDDADGRPLQFTGEASGWEAFRAYRDHAIRTIQDRISAEVSDDTERVDHDRASIPE